ncbi:MAG: hypothetical protein Q4E99_03660 [Bacillota bacterium]|nr:hypothetical protein [Bacillota bacterium]
MKEIAIALLPSIWVIYSIFTGRYEWHSFVGGMTFMCVIGTLYVTHINQKKK